MAFNVRPYESYTSQFKNPYSFSGRVNKDVSALLANSLMRAEEEELEAIKGRSGLDRVIDALMLPVYTGAGFVDGLIDGGVNKDGSLQEDRNPFQGAWEGIKAGNPFGDGFEAGETTYSDVLHTAGWQPTSTLGKIAKGTVGFGLDVLLDPTTYLTGGLSAVVKGTGRVGKTAEGVAKMADNIPYMQFDNTVKELVDKGINPKLAERFAMKKLDESLNSASKATHMTDEMAETIVKYQTNEKGIARTAEEIKQSATKLADEYNRVMGIRDARGAGNVTFGIGNLPFAPKKWEKYNVRLGSQKPLQSFSDSTGISNAYSKIRASIYGTQIGKMFSTTSPLYKLAQDEPAKLWEGLEFIEHTRGMKLDKLQAERQIRERFKSFGLTEAENKEVLALLQNKTVWNKVAEKVKFTDLAKTQEARTVFEEASARTQQELDDLIAKRDTAETWQKALDDELVTEREFLDVMKREFRDDLAKIDTENITKIDQMEFVIKSLNDEIASLEKSIAKNQNPMDALDELYELSKKEREAFNKHMSERADLQGNKLEGQNKQEHVTSAPKRKKYHDSAKQKELKKTHDRLQKEIEKLVKKEESDQVVLKDLNARQSDLERQIKIASENNRATKRLTNELNRVKKEIEHLRESNSIRMTEDAVTGKKIAKQNGVQKLRGELHQIKREMDANTIYRSGADKIESSKAYDALRKGMNEAIDEEAFARAMGAPGRENTQKLTKALSNLLYGESGHLRNLSDSNIDAIMKRIADGEELDDVRYFIESNPAVFDPHMQDVFEHVASKLNYKKWHDDGFKRPLGKLLGMGDDEIGRRTTLTLQKQASEKYATGEFNEKQMKEFMRLLQTDMKRRMLIEDYSKMSPTEFSLLRTKEVHDDLMKNLPVDEDGFLKLTRDQAYQDQSALIDAKTGKDMRHSRGMNDKEYATEFAKLQTADRITVVQDMIKKNIFNREAVHEAMDGANAGLYRHMNAIVDEVNALLQKQFKKNYDDLSNSQKNLVLNLAVKNIQKGTHGIDNIVSRRATQEMARRAREDAVEAIRKEVTIGHDLLFKVDGTLYRGIVESVERASIKETKASVRENVETGAKWKGFDEVETLTDDVVYRVKVPTSGEIIEGVRPSDVQRVRVNKERLTPEEILGRSDVIKSEIARKEKLMEELTKAQDELTSFTSYANKRQQDAIDFYRTRVREQEGEILKLEGDHQKWSKVLKEEASEENITALQKSLDEMDEILQKDDALETWMRTNSQADLELLKDPTRYSRVKFVDDLDDPAQVNLQTGEMLFKNQNWTPDEVFNYLGRYMQKRLADEGWSKERIIKALSSNPERAKRAIIEHEYSHLRHKNNDMNVSKFDNNNRLTREFVDMEVRAHREAFEMIENFDVDKMLREAQPLDTNKIWLSNMASSEKVEKTVRILRAEFDRIGEEEIAIGKLTQEQFDGLMNQYVPHILTPAGEEHFAKLRELTEHGSKVSHDLGYGVKYNPHQQSRTIQGKTVEEINEHFRDTLKGKNLFSENVADVYLKRALEHVDLMYDDKYMRTMMNVFGKDIPSNGVIEKGYKAVMNHGMLKATSSDIASMNVSAHISNDVSDYVKNNYQMFKQASMFSNKNVDEYISERIEEYLQHNYSDDTLKELFDSYHKRSIGDAKLSDQILGRDSTPMVEMNTEQIQGIRQAWDEAYQAQLNALNNAMSGARQRGDMKRIGEIQKRMERFAQRTPPQIKQVNDVIVSKANQARKLQQAKDQSRFLQMYDKFLHFMKLNQTVVTPAFHARNKVSNAYLNWLGVGRDAVDKDLQIASTVLARANGDVQSVIESGKLGHKQLSRPLNIDNPHPELVEAVGLNNGQLHWKDIYELAVRYNVIDNGAFAQDIGAGAMTKGKFKNARITRKDGRTINVDPTDTENFVLYKKGTEVGTVVENGDRILHFASMLRQGKSIEEASRSSRKFLFDYSDLTAFEQSVMKRIFPYYTWLRKNARLQVDQLIEQPEKFRTVAKVITGIEHMTPEEERMNGAYIGGWAQGWIQMPWDVKTSPAQVDPLTGEATPAKREKVLFNPALPFMDINRIPDITQPLGSLKELFTQTSPQIKVPLEQLTNHNAFLETDIAKEGDSGGQQMLSRINHLLSQFGLYNYGSGFVQKDNLADFGMHTMATFTGAKANSVDYETSKHMFKERLADKRENMKRYLKELGE